MKISYRNHPILEKLHKGSLGNMPMFPSDKIFFDHYGEGFTRNWKFHHKKFQKEINVISNTFREATIKAWANLMGIWEDILVNDISDFDVQGCYILGDFVYMLYYEVKKGSENNEIFFYMFDKQGLPLAMFIDSAKHEIHQNGWISQCFGVENNPVAIQTWIHSKMVTIVFFKMFKSYAQVETKILPPNSKLKDINCKYINDTPFEITHLDSKWFTNIINSEGFSVRGHFRLQPKKKDGEWTKELIWISEFEKSGYTAPARILKHKE